MSTLDLSVDELLTDVQLRELLGISRTTLWRLRKFGGVPYGKVGRSYRYRKSEVLRWIADNPQQSHQLHLNLDSEQ
ncbi:helix-turn-helix domain-containing protein [uncultured Thiodictyon sp.]|nr:helix-turn-helix domain-containing protein [uncultured Thiodictyon sp.]